MPLSLAFSCAGALRHAVLAWAFIALPAASAAQVPATYDLRVIDGSRSGSGLSADWAAVELGSDGHRCSGDGCSLIPALPNDSGEAGISTSGMNRRGWVVGASPTLRSGVRHAVLFDGRLVRDLGALPDDDCGGCSLTSFAAAINHQGDAVGYSQDGFGNDMAVRWRRGQGVERLGTLGGLKSQAYDINDDGVVVGAAHRVDGTAAPFVWRKGVMQELPSPDGRLPASAILIDNAGRVVVGTGRPTNARSFLVHGGQATPIAERPDATDVIALDMDERGQVVGYWILWNGRTTATSGFLFDGRQAHDLNDHLPPWARRAFRILSADAINDRGQILAWAHHKASFDTVMVVLTPRPLGNRTRR